METHEHRLSEHDEQPKKEEKHMTTAKLALFMGAHTPFEIRTFPVIEPQSGMARMKLIASGICGTDMHFMTGCIPLQGPQNIGHEFVGQIDAISAEDTQKTGLHAGDNVIVDIACPCGKCPLCLQGDDANCVQMTAANEANPLEEPYFVGGYGEVNFTRVDNLIKIPAAINPETAAVFACAGPTALHAFELSRRANRPVSAMKTAVVQGLGPVGQFAVMYLKSIGVPHVAVITTGKNPRRDELARAFGADEVWRLNELSDAEIVSKAKAMSDGLGVDLVYEASGSVKAVPLGMQLLRNRGVYLIPGQYSDSGEAPIMPQLITFNALQLIGSSQYSMTDVYRYLDFLSAHPELHEKINALITRYTVDDVNHAFDDVAAGRCVKALLVKGENA